MNPPTGKPTGIAPPAVAPALAATRDALEAWLESHAWASCDPYDALTSPLLRPLFAVQPLARAALQAVKRSPFDLRPLLGIRPGVYTKSLSDLAAAYMLLHRLRGEERDATRAREFLAQLRARALPGFPGTCWGMDLPYVSRFATATPAMPNLFQTVNAGMALLDAHAAWGDDADLALALGVVDFLERGLGRLQDGPCIAWRYYPGQDALVYNVNALTAALLARLAQATRRDDLADLARRTFAFVLSAQNEDGSWWYAQGPAGRWVDGFHSGYVLESLAIARDAGYAVEESLQRGAAHFLAAMFTSDDIPRYTDRATYPIEVQNCAQAIQTLARLAPFVPEARLRAPRVAARVIEQLFRVTRRAPHTEGYFIMSRGRLFTNRLAAVRWGQAPMLLALAHLEAMDR